MTIPILYLLALLIAYVSGIEKSKTFLAIKKTPTRAKPVAAHTSDFLELVKQSDVFVDKTSLLKHFLGVKSKTVLLNLPKKWGKSLNLHMLKTFVEIEKDNDGNPITVQTESPNYRLFKLGEVIHSDGEIERLKNPLHVSMHKNLFTKHQGKHPVILLKLGSIDWSDFHQLFEITKARVSEAFSHHEYLVEGFEAKLTGEDMPIETKERVRNNLEIFTKILEKKSSEKEFLNSLTLLCDLLYTFYNKRVFLLIDDWDGVAYSLIFNTLISSYEARHMTDFYSSFFNITLNDNEYMEKCVMTGTLRGKELFIGMDDAKEYHSTISAFYFRFGFTDEEVVELFNHLHIPQELRDRADDWYDGYRRTDNSTERIYSPVSIANFVSSRKIDNYRIKRKHDVYNLMVNNFKSSEFRNRLRNLVIDNELSMSYVRLNHRSFFKFADRFRIDPSSVLRREYENIVWSYFHDAGYFTYCHRSLAFSVTTRIINDEIRNEILTALIEYYKENFGISTAALEQAVDDLALLIDDQSTERINDLISSLTSILYNISKELVNLIIQYLASTITKLYNYRSKKPETFYYKDPNTKQVNYEIYLTLDDIIYSEDCAALIKAQVDGPSARNTVKQIKEFDYKSELSKIPTITKVVFIAINIMPSNEIDIHTESELFFGNT